ncbi:hypothetical protein [Sporisorium scitamineum]|nr:hypothetical protein [Sporisorium scitamineum]
MEDVGETPGRSAAASSAEQGEEVEKQEVQGVNRLKTAQDVKEQSAAEGDANGTPKEEPNGVNGISSDEHNPTILSTTTPLYTEHPIPDHDLILHFGDLNFRLDISHSEAHRLIRQRDYPTLYRYDQLESLRTSGSLFDDFVEGRIDFAPTYKFDKGTDRYDTSEKGRVPAWCDRVMWCVTREWEDGGGSATGEGVVLQAYESVGEVKFSDHKPVRATLLVRVR